MAANAEEFFHHLNLSKCSGSKMDGQDQTPIPAVRKYPLTRYTHQALIQLKKCDANDPEPNEDVSATKRAKSSSKKKRLTLAQKIIQLKNCDQSQNKTAVTDVPKSASPNETNQVEGEGGDFQLRFHELKHSTKSDEDESEKMKNVIRKEIEKGTDHDVLQKEKQYMKDLKPPYRCSTDSCTVQFNDLPKFIRHFRDQNDSMPYSCTRCSSKFKHRSDLASHLKRHLGVKNIKCEQCGEMFDKTRSLTTHLIVKHGKNDPRPRNFKCTECGDAFLSKVAVDRHMRWHTGYRPETCPCCGASFHTPYDLKEHSRVHSGEKPYSCDQCKYTARTPQMLNRHKKTHTKEKPFACEECKFTCNNSGSLKRHVRSHSGKKPYKCPYCKHSCANIENLRKHIKTIKKHKGLKIYPCSHCMSYSTDDSNEYLRHMKQYHFPYLDLKSATATKLSGILVEEDHTPDDHDSDEEVADMAGNSIFENGHESILRGAGLTQHPLNMGGIHPTSNILPELGLRSAMEGLNDSDLQCLDSNVDDVTRCDKGDIFLSSVASQYNHDSCKAETFSSGPFDDESCVVGSYANSAEPSVSNFPHQQPTGPVNNEAVGKTTEENATANTSVNLSQGYVAVLVKWPSNEKVELQQGTAEGGVPLTLVINSNPVFLRAAENDAAHSEAKNLPLTNTTQVENITAGKSYIMSPNGLVLASEKSSFAGAGEIIAKKSLSPVQCNVPQTETFKTKSSINVSSRPPNIFATSPEKNSQISDATPGTVPSNVMTCPEKMN